MKRFNKGDRVRKRGDQHIGTIIQLRERGVAGSAVTYVVWIMVQYDNGMTIKGDPIGFEKVEDCLKP